MLTGAERTARERRRRGVQRPVADTGNEVVEITDCGEFLRPAVAQLFLLKLLNSFRVLLMSS
jgi:hypothetical protein